MSGLKPSILTVGKFLFYSVSEHGITFTAETPRDEWLDAVKRLCHFHDSSLKLRERTLMLLADALNFGQDAYGEEFSQAIDGTREALGLTVKTVQNAMYTYKRIPVALRRVELSLSHYKEISPLGPAEQEKFIARAIKEKMPVSMLKKEIAEAHPKTKRGKIRKAVEIDDEKTALQKITDSESYALSIDINDLSEKWKSHVETFYKIYRRRWLTKKKRK